MPDLSPYDRQFLRQQNYINRQILRHYQDSINFLVPAIKSLNYKGIKFNLSDYPALKQRVEKMTQQLHNQVYSTIVNGIKESWSVSNKKNDVLVDQRLAKKNPKPKVRQVLYDPNKKALEAFIKRSENGLDLSKRVWKLMEPFKAEIEQGLGIGIGSGVPATEIAKDLQKNLQNGDNLFRRVRGEDGKLHLSAAARNYNPGQGVYRSSFKNAMRLARTETNMSYRTADYNRWKTMPFVLGIQVKLSNAHPKYDICDVLAGVYPKDFLFNGWHAQCICFAVPVMMSDAEYDKYEDSILNGKPIPPASGSVITSPPPAFGRYLKEKQDMLSRLKREPYWIRDNKGYVKDALGKK